MIAVAYAIGDRGSVVRPCTRCGAIKPFEAFAKDRRKPSGHAGRCLECAMERCRIYRQNPEVQQRQRADGRRRRLEHYAEVREYERKRSSTVEQDARRKLRNAVKRGDIVKPAICQTCGRKGVTHGHHPDYSQPLAVEWLCSRCHANIHRRTIPCPPIGGQNMGDIRMVVKRPCRLKNCPDAGRLGHSAHTTCVKADCLDRGINHWGDHRVRIVVERAAEHEE